MKKGLRKFSYKPTLERLEDRTVPSATWNNFGGDAQHTDVAGVAAQPIDQLRWQVPLDLGPWGYIHYGDPVFTPNNVVVVPIKVTWDANNQGKTNFIEVGMNDVTGAVLWSTAPLGSITGASNVGNTIVLTTNNTNGLANGDYVTIGDMQGDTAANTGSSNATYQISNVTSTSFTLDNVTGNGTYTGGGLWVLTTTSSTATSYIEPAYSWLPPDQAAYDPGTDRVYFPGPGGTIDYISNPHTATGVVTPVQEAFYGLSNYTNNPSAYNASIYVNTPVTVDAQGNIYFGYAITGSNPSNITEGGIARISASGAVTNVSAFAAANTAGQNPSDDGNWVAALGSAPALSNDGSTVYFAVDDGGYGNSGGGEYNAYLVGLNSSNLQPTYSVRLYDPTTGTGVPTTGVQNTGNGAGVIDQSTASPMVAPDGTIFMGVFGSNYDGSRGSLLHYSGNLQSEYTPGAFGWDDTPSIVPTSMVPSYTGSSSYLILSKYNNYANAETGSSGGNGVNEIAVLDPYASQPDPNNDPQPNGQPIPVMKQILTLASPSPDIPNINGGDPDAVREWCTNGTAVDPTADSIFVNNEDGYTYEWNLGSNTITHTVEVSAGYGVPYTPTAISPNGEVFSDNAGTLFALGGYSNYSIATVSSANPAVYGTPFTLTTTLASTSGGPTPTGTITYTAYAGANNPLNYNTNPIMLGTATINNSGVASLTLSGTQLLAAHYHITASYSGDSNYSAGHTTIALPILETVTTGVSASANPVAKGTSVTFTATITPNGTSSTVVQNGSGASSYWVPIGTVTFMDGSTVLGTVNMNPLEAGGPNGNGTYPSSYIQQVTFTASSLPVGTDAITAVYSGDQNFAGGPSAVFDETVGGTTTVVTSATNPTIYGQKATFTATVTPMISGSGNPTGIVTFFDGTTELGTANVNATTGQATYTTTALALPAGSNSITASYGGDTNFAASTSAVFTQTVNQDNTATTVTSSVNPSVYGQRVTLSAVVTAQAPGSGTATGLVTFYDGSTTLGTGTLNGSGRASLITTAFALSLGSNSITATYGGDANFKTSTSRALNVTVNQDTTKATLTSSASTAVFGQSVTFTAMITANAPGSGVPTGTVIFYDGMTQIGTGTLNSLGKATLTTSSLVLGSHSITVSYSGDPNYRASTSAALVETIDKAATRTVVTSSHNPSVFGQSVTFTAKVTVKSPGSGNPTGTVKFMDGSTVLGTGTLNSMGQATFTTSSLAIGSHSITAIYEGGTDFTTSTSASLRQTVNKASTTITLASSLNPVPPNTLVTFTATVLPKAPGAGMPTGSVSFYDGTTLLGTVNLNGHGQASWTTSWPTAGRHSIKAVYSGDGDFLTSTSAVLTETVS